MICVFKCPNCGDEMKYDNDKHVLVCLSCESELRVEEYDYSNMVYNDRKIISDELSGFSCPNCGSEAIVNKIEANVTCPYCNKSMSVFGLAENEMEPEMIIPFSFDENGAFGKLLTWWQSKETMPKLDREKLNLKFEETYIPVWLYNGSTYVGMDATVAPFEGSIKDVNAYSDIFEIHKNVSASFEKVPIVGSAKTNSKIFHEIEPYNYSGLETFNPGYLSGHKAERYYYSHEQQLPNILLQLQKYGKEQCKESVETDKLGGTILKSRITDIQIMPDSVIYALLPLWICTYEYKNKSHQIFINGQTGKAWGEVLYERQKYKIENAVFIVSSILCFVPLLSALVYLSGFFGIGDKLTAFISFFFIVPIIVAGWLAGGKGKYSSNDNGKTIDFRTKINISEKVQYKQGGRFSIVTPIIIRFTLAALVILFQIIIVIPVRVKSNDNISLIIELLIGVLFVITDVFFFIRKRKQYIERHDSVDYFEYLKFDNVHEEPAKLLKTNF